MTYLPKAAVEPVIAAREGVMPQAKRTKIENIYKERQLAMQAINDHLSKEARYFSNRYLKPFNSRARILDPKIWLKADPSAIEIFLISVLKDDYDKVPANLLEQIIAHLSDQIKFRNKIYFLPEESFADAEYGEIYLALLRGNLLQDFTFDIIANDKKISTEVRSKLKKAVRLLLRAITVLQFNLLDSDVRLREVELLAYLEKYGSAKVMAKLGKLIDKSKPGNLLTNALKLVNKKLSRGSVRSSFVTWVYEYFCSVGGQSESKEIDRFLRNDFPLIIEVAMTIMYYDNQILDQKGGIKDLEEIKHNLLSRSILKDWCFEVIEWKLNQPEDQLLVADLLRKIFVSVDVGQYVDKNLNTFSKYVDQSFVYCSLEKDLPNELWQSRNPENTIAGKKLIDQCLAYTKNDSFSACFDTLRKEIGDSKDHLNLYLDRIFLTSSMLFLLSLETISQLTGFVGSEKDKMVGMIIGYSLSLQIINDYADFMPISKWSSRFGSKTVEKKSGDIFKDLENGTVSLPILIHLAKCGSKSLVYQLLDRKARKLSRIQKYQVLKEFHKERTLFICEKLSQSMARKVKSKYKIHRTNRASLFLRDLWSICFVNRYQRERTYIDQGFEFIQGLFNRLNCKKKPAKLELVVFDSQQLLIACKRKVKKNIL